MRSTTISCIVVCMLIVSFAITGCNRHIKSFEISKYNPNPTNFEKYFNSGQVSSLKNEWEDLYYYLKREHVQSANVKGEEIFVFSFDLYKFLQANLLNFYTTPFLQNYENYVKIFGKPEYFHDDGKRIEIVYARSIIGDSCRTCTHHGIGFKFDAKTKKLVKE
ncbi:MAG: hypothetical protein IPN76_32730 [Saprospiraceae bacterium]|nr:hypothetical protein [Saprospiraceae bacterium]